MNATARNLALHSGFRNHLKDTEQYIILCVQEKGINCRAVAILDDIEAKIIEAMELVKKLPGDEVYK